MVAEEPPSLFERSFIGDSEAVSPPALVNEQGNLPIYFS
jgi:hypothetical protein